MKSNTETVVFDESFKDARLKSCQQLFSNFQQLTTFKGWENFNTSEVTSMAEMFTFCNAIQSLDLSGFNTANVTDMSQMFNYCQSLVSLDLSGFKTANVTDMSQMFNYCQSLVSLDLSGFNTANVTDMSQMFNYCQSLVLLDLSGFNTAEVVNMSNMFRLCIKLMDLDLSGFYTANVTDMSQMFGSCKALASLNLSSFNTASVETMESMFLGCASLKVLDLSSFNTANVKNMAAMFSGCTSLDTIRVTGCFTTGQITDSLGTWDMFADCPATGNYGPDSRLTAELVPSAKYEFNIGTGARTVTFTMAPKVMPSGTDALKYVAIGLADGQAFRDSLGSSVGNDRLSFVQTAVFDESFKDVRPTSCRMWFWGFQSLAAVKGLENLNTSDVTDMSRMFGHCKSLTSLDLSHFNTAKVESFREMLRNCEGIQSFDLSGFSTNRATDMYAMFSQCFSLKSVKLPSWENVGWMKDMSAMFFECKALQELDLRSLRLADSHCQYMYNMFKGCTSLKKILATTKLLPENANITNMFDGCTRLTGNYGPDNKLTVAFTPRAVWNPTDKTLTFKQVDEVIDGNAENSFAVLNTGMDSPAWLAVCAETLQAAIFDESFKEMRPTSCYQWFRGCKNLAEVKGLENLNTSETKYFNNMFRECSSLTSIDLSGLDFGSVTDYGVECLFKNCTSLTTANLSGLNAAWSTYGMFTGCTSLKQVDLTGFNTSRVTTMSEMFSGCTSLEELDLTSFRSDKLEKMEDMFSDCTSLKTIYVSDAFNTQKVYSSNQPFRNCTSLRGAVAFADVKKTYVEMANYTTGYFKTYYKVGGEHHDIAVMDGALHVDNLQLEDGRDFMTCAPFTAGTVTHTRQLKGDGASETVWGSLCLPYSLKPSEAGLTCYTLDNVTYDGDGDGTVYVKPLVGDTLPAGTPVFFRADANTTLNLGTLDAVDVVRQPLDGTAGAQGGVYLRGDFAQYDITEGYALMGNGLWNISAIAEQDSLGYKVRSKGFRAYLAPVAGQTARARRLRFVASDDETTAITGTEAIGTVSGTMAERFDLSGRRLSVPRKGLSIVRTANGKVRKLTTK